MKSFHIFRSKFQSTLPRRERQDSIVRDNDYNGFQSTLPRRERLKKEPKKAGVRDFNPRSREGSDFFCQLFCTLFKDFNPRSREGSDLDPIEIPFPNILFQSTLPRRERPYGATLKRKDGHFNPRSREGSDCMIQHYLSIIQ